MKYEVATIIKDHIKELILTPHQYKVLTNIMYCRTKDMGQHLKKCTNKKCKHEEIVNNSCQDRNCPKCQMDKQIIWKDKRLKDLLQTYYMHLVFLIPRSLYKLFQYNKEVCYKLHLRAINNTIRKINKNLGYISSTETWSQLGNYHPHVHVIMPEIEFKTNIKRFILKKEYLNIIYKKELLKELKKHLNNGNIEFNYLDLDELETILINLKNYVHVKSNIKDIAQVIDYLGNNTNRIGMTDSRIEDYDGKTVTYSYKDRTDGNKKKKLKLNALLFLKRYVINIMPAKFTRIRYFGFLSNISKKKLELIKSILSKLEEKIESTVNKVIVDNIKNLVTNINKSKICCECGVGILKFDRFIKPKYGL